MAIRKNTKPLPEGAVDYMMRGAVTPNTKSQQHAALKQVAKWLDEDDKFEAADAICEHFTLLTESPQYAKFMERAKQSDPEELAQDGISHGSERRWLQLVC